MTDEAGVTRGGDWWMSHPDPVSVVDSTGAGDAFAGGYLSVWLSGGEPDAALVEGHRVAALAVARLGGRPG